MVARVTHTKVSGKAAGTDSTRIYGTHWDADHTITGLDNVDNTSDVDKPVSSATAAALAAAIDDLAVTVSTVAALKALTVTATTRVFVAGYYAEGDGGGGWFYGSTGSAATANDGTIMAPDAGTGRWLRDYDGSNINVKWFGLKGDNTTESVTLLNAARDLAISLRGGLYFPATTSRYLLTTAGLVIPDDTHGLRIFGDAKGPTPGTANNGSCVVTTGATLIDMTGISLGGTGSISDIVIEHLNLFSSGATGKCVKAWNVDALTITDCVLDATQGVALDMAGTAHFNINNTKMFAAGGSPFRGSQDGVGTQNIGPGVWNGGQATITNGAHSSIDISGDPLGVIFQNIQVTWVNSSGSSVIELNGPSSGTAVGSISFINCHTESTYKSSGNTGITFRVGNTNKFGSLIIDGGNYWGHGNGTLYQRDFLQVVAARSVVVRGVTTSKLSATNGFSRAMIRLETTFPTASDNYRFENNLADVSGSMYSDVNGRLTGTVDGSYPATQINTLTLINALAAAQGGTGLTALGTGVATFLGTPSSANLIAALTDETGTGANVFANTPTMVTPVLGAATATSINGVTLDTNAWTSYTPTVTSSANTITTVSATGGYKLFGKTCCFWARAVITTNGTGSGRVDVTLPFTAANSLALSGANGTSGIVLSASVITSVSTTKALLTNSTGAYPGADGWVGLVSGVFETT